jgi:7-cyano-7-deazaguanine synthase
MGQEKAVVLFSGGLDSTTALYWAGREFAQATALIFNYSQRHHIEVEMAEKIAARLNVEYHKIELPLLNLARSALIDREAQIPESLAASKDKSGIPFTYVPFRNGIFLSIAAAFAESRGIYHLVTGFNCIDTPDYPDTTEAFTRKMEAAINQGTSAAIKDFKFTIHTPLIEKTKKEIVEFGLQLGADYSYSVSCYRGDEIPCLACPSCDIRSAAFKELGMEDPLIGRLKKEKRL